MVTPKTRDLIVVGASAGGVEALRQFASGLPHDLAASILVVLHLPPGGTSALPAILRAAGPLRAVGAQHGMELEHGWIYTARPNHHLLVTDGSLALSHGPTENGRRPAINALFRSAALAGGPRVTGVLLSGMLDDGVAGLIAIAGGGGTVLVQDPDDAIYPSMPRHAMQALPIDHVVRAGAMGVILDKISREEIPPIAGRAPSRALRWENEIAAARVVARAAADRRPAAAGGDGTDVE
jgi:two-component system, chemotaxis family, protein-glutamate methylesterase/glutaminase